MRTIHARRIRAAIIYARRLERNWRPFDAFTRGMHYRHFQPRHEPERRAYRRTWQRLEHQREGTWASVRPQRNV